MSYQALARKYRPQTFTDIVGQETIVRTLQNAIESGRIHHAYLFSGVRGVGKTTAARILAKALNCEHGPAVEPCNECSICREITEGIDLDVREIDAATYTGVDNIRDLREVTQFQPARDRYRVFIIDEAHMLSMPAWNALLKIIEEPPPHVIFMFATTEVNKVPPTILSRVQKFSLRKITLNELIERIEQIASAEGIEANRAAVEIIARRGEGSVRDSLSLLDQVIAFSGRSISAEDVATVLGLSDASLFGRILSRIGAGDHAGLLEAIQEAADGGRDFKLLFRDLLHFIRNLLLITGGASESLLSAAPEELVVVRKVATEFSYTELLRIANLLLRDDETINRAEHQRLAVEIALLKAATLPRLRSVEEALAGGATPRTSAKAIAAAAPKTSKASSSAAPVEEAAAPPAAATATAGPELEALIAGVQKKKPVLANYLAKASAVARDGSRILLTFDDPSYVDYVQDARDTLEQVAREIFGAATTVEASAAGAASPSRREADKPSALRDDPVVRAFQKHLGADLVDSRKK